MFSPGFPPKYNPFTQHPVDEPPPIPDAVMQKAKRAGAHKISTDGQRIFDTRYGQIWIADWINEDLNFGAWRAEPEVKMPGDAIELK